jgi:pimeloyl-ACP methyl ester carboxylesterase
MAGGQDIWYSLNGGGSAVGSDPPLVLIHGAGGSHLHWAPTTRRLSGRSVYAIDLPGHGHSPGEGSANIAEYVEAVSSWLRGLGLQRPVVAGHSMGGAIALSLALDLPESLGGLVLVGTSDHLPVNPTLLRMLEKDETWRDAIDLIIRWSFSRSADPRLVELSRKRMLETPRNVLHADFQACARYDVQGRVGQIRIPTLVVCGVDDKMTPVRTVRGLTQSIRDSRFSLVEGAGHMVMLEKPSILDDAVQNFLAEEAL